MLQKTKLSKTVEVQFEEVEKLVADLTPALGALKEALENTGEQQDVTEDLIHLKHSISAHISRLDALSYGINPH